MENQLTIIDLFNLGETRQEWIARARDVARELGREVSVFTIEDVLARCPRPDHINPNATGPILRNRDFETVGITKARHTAANGRFIFKWRLKERS